MKKSKYVLLVEDNRDDEELTIRALRKGNILNPVEVARDGAEALDFLFAKGKYTHRDLQNVPQLILLDLKLPKINGLEVLKAIRQNQMTKQIAMAILTSSREERDIVESYENGVNSYICKPVDVKQFTAAVQQLGLYWLVLNETP